MAEYDQFVAAVDIYHPPNDITGSLAYRAGDPVPASNVTLLDYADLGWVQTFTNPTGAFIDAAFSADFA